MMKRAVSGIALLAALVAMTDADAQRRRMPVRTDPIPETETAAERAATKANEAPANPNMMIYGPPTPVIGAPPSAPLPESLVKPAPAAPIAAPAPAAPPTAPVAAPAPSAPALVPAPIVTPTPPPAAPIAVPLPAPVPVAVPAPAPVAPAPVAAPAPVLAPKPPTPVAVPAPVVVPPQTPAAAAVPRPIPAPVAAPAIAPAPVVIPAPVAAPAPPPAPVVATIAPAPSSAPKLDAKMVEQIFSCLAPGLPQDWKRTWVVVTSTEAAVTTKFFFTASYRDEDAEEFVPCSVQEITRRITGLSDSLAPAQRRWKSARLAIDSEGEYELVYDYTK